MKHEVIYKELIKRWGDAFSEMGLTRKQVEILAKIYVDVDFDEDKFEQALYYYFKFGIVSV